MKILKDVKYVFSSLISSLIVFFVIFLLLLRIMPKPDNNYLTVILNTYKAGKWVETPCIITSGKVSFKKQRKSKPHGEYVTYNIYYPDISYSYKVKNIEFKSARYSSFYFLSEDEVKTIVKDYPHEKKTVCYVNPSGPEEAVLNRESLYKVFNRIIEEESSLYYIMLMLLFFPVIMTVMGLVVRKTIFRHIDFDKTSSIENLMNIMNNRENKK